MTVPRAFKAYEEEFRTLVAKKPQPLKEIVEAENGGGDQPQEAAVEAPEVENWAAARQLTFFYVSGQTGDRIVDMFQCIAE
jgi:hypothetical protein